MTNKPNPRDALFDAAERLFVENGYAAVGTREIADAAGVNLGAIQYYFGSKAQLFVHTVHRLMERQRASRPIPVENRHKIPEVMLAHYVVDFLDHLTHPTGPQACRIVFREIFSELARDPEMCEALLSSVVEEFIRPCDGELLEILRLLTPEKAQRDLELVAQSIIGQCTFYFTHGPFLRRLRSCDFAAPPHFEDAARHIVSFSLRALASAPDAIEKALQATGERIRERDSSRTEGRRAA